MVYSCSVHGCYNRQAPKADDGETKKIHLFS